MAKGFFWGKAQTQDAKPNVFCYVGELKCLLNLLETYDLFDENEESAVGGEVGLDKGGITCRGVTWGMWWSWVQFVYKKQKEKNIVNASAKR